MIMTFQETAWELASDAPEDDEREVWVAFWAPDVDASQACVLGVYRRLESARAAAARLIADDLGSWIDDEVGSSRWCPQTVGGGTEGTWHLLRMTVQ